MRLYPMRELRRKGLKVSDIPDEVSEAYGKIVNQSMVLVGLVALYVLIIMNTMLVHPAFCDYVHRTGRLQADGTIKYIHNEVCYVQSDRTGDIGDEFDLCFHNNSDEFIRVCPYTPDEKEVVGFILAGAMIGGIFLIITVGYLIISNTKPAKICRTFFNSR